MIQKSQILRKSSSEHSSKQPKQLTSSAPIENQAKGKFVQKNCISYL